MDDTSPVYFRLYWPEGKDPCVVMMQWFDEPDYDQDRFLSDARFDSEAEAESGLETALCYIVGHRVREIEKAVFE